MTAVTRRGFLKALSTSFILHDLRPCWIQGAVPFGLSPFEERKQASFEQVLPSISGISWRHVNGRSPSYYLPETTGAGCAFLDYDNDGWMDIYLVNSGLCDFYEPNPPLRNALYRNNRDGTFTDVTEKAGVSGGGYGMGAAVGDYDGDGYPDLFLSQYGRSILYHNTMATAHLLMSRKKLALQHTVGPPVPYGSTMTTMESWTFSSAALWILINPRTNCAAMSRQVNDFTASHVSIIPRKAGFFTTMATGLSPMSPKNPALLRS
jgi:hypothetical protein